MTWYIHCRSRSLVSCIRHCCSADASAEKMSQQIDQNVFFFLLINKNEYIYVGRSGKTEPSTLNENKFVIYTAKYHLWLSQYSFFRPHAHLLASEWIPWKWSNRSIESEEKRLTFSHNFIDANSLHVISFKLALTILNIKVNLMISFCDYCQRINALKTTRTTHTTVTIICGVCHFHSGMQYTFAIRCFESSRRFNENINSKIIIICTIPNQLENVMNYMKHGTYIFTVRIGVIWRIGPNANSIRIL